MQQLHLSIPEPCHEDWQQMTPTEQGRFCNACAKQVVDFSNMSDAHVLNYFSSIKNDKVCGRAYPDQLERAITMPKEPKKRLFWHWNYITMLFLFFSKTNAAKAQGDVKATTVLQPNSVKPVNINEALLGRVGGVRVINSNIFKGKVTDEKGEAIGGASVIIKGSKQIATTDVAGNYTITSNSKEDILVISMIGFTQKEIQLNGFENANVVLTKIVNPSESPVVIMGKFLATLPPQLPLYVVDGVQFPNGIPLGFNWNNVDKIDILKYSEATAIYGMGGSKGAMIITTKKKVVDPVYKSLDSVKIISSYGKGCRRTIGGAISVVSQQTQNTFKDSLKIIATKITGALKIYPNPVTKGNAFNIELKLKDAGSYNIQIIDASGRMMLQQQIVAGTKQYTGQLQTSNTWSSGVYYIRILNSDNKMISTNSVLVQ